MDVFTNFEPERWKAVVGWEGLYEVSTYGRVRSLPRQTASGVRGGKILRPIPVEGYYRVRLSKNGDNRAFVLIHHLVAEAFIWRPKDATMVEHLNNNRLHNHVNNLLWSTHAKNMKTLAASGILKGIGNSNAKFVDKQIIEIRGLFDNGKKSARKLAKIYGVSKSTILAIVHRKTWNHVGGQ